MPRGGELSRAVLDEFSDPKVIAEELDIEERLDAKIDKDIAGLGRLKTMQAMGLGGGRISPTNRNDESLKEIVSPPIQNKKVNNQG